MVETKQFKVDNVKIRVKDERARADIASNFSESASYAVGDLVLYGGYLYKFTSAHSAGTWIGTDATQITIAGELKSTISDTVSSINTALAGKSDTSHTHSYLPLSGGTLTGDVLFDNSETTTRQLRFTVGDDDYGRVAAGATESDAGWFELASAGDGNEPVYVRQYTGEFETVSRTATLLDENGNTNFPGTITQNGTAVSLSGHTHSYLPLSGGTMTGQLFTSFKSSVAMGSYQSSQTTVPNLVNEVRYSSGCAGSVNIGTAYSLNGVTVGGGWYNFFYSPHRSGGVNGAASGDNQAWGTLLLCGMTVSGMFQIRIGNNSIAECLNVNGLYSSSDLAHGSSTLASGQVYYVYV